MTAIWGEAYREFMQTATFANIETKALQLWACHYCKARFNRADDQQCFNCGAPSTRRAGN